MQQLDQLTPPRDASRRTLQTWATPRSPSCPLPVAGRRTRLLIGCYRKVEADDPEVYASAIAMVLSDYPEQVVMRVTDPRTGIPGRIKYPPQLFEIREACEREMDFDRTEQRRQAERERTRLVLAGGRPRVPRAAWDALRAKLAAAGGEVPDRTPPPRAQWNTKVVAPLAAAAREAGG